MTKRKLTALLLGAAMTLTGAVCAASVSSDQISVGGIYYGESLDEVKAVYGTPTETKYRQSQHYDGQAVEYEFGEDLEVTLVNGTVRNVEVSGHSSLVTPAGVRVGMSKSELYRIYGEPDMIRGDKLVYRCDSDANLGLVFEMSNGQIEEIEAGTLKYH